MFNNKRILISGGTGSFGSKMLKYLISTKVKEIRIFSRDEKKQEDLRRSIKDKRVNYIIGDVKTINQSFLNKKYRFCISSCCIKTSSYM